MVLVNAIQELGPVGIIAQKGLFVIGHSVGTRVRIVLVEVGDQVVVLIPTRKNRAVHWRALPRPVGEAVLVIVVIDELVKTQRAAVVDNAVAVDDLETGLVVGIKIKSFEQREIGVVGVRYIQHPGLRLLAGHMVLFQVGVGILFVLLVNVDFEIGVKPFKIAHFHCETSDLVGGGQTIIERQYALIRRILDIARRPGHRHRHDPFLKIGLPIRGHPN